MLFEIESETVHGHRFDVVAVALNAPEGVGRAEHSHPTATCASGCAGRLTGDARAARRGSGVDPWWLRLWLFDEIWRHRAQRKLSSPAQGHGVPLLPTERPTERERAQSHSQTQHRPPSTYAVNLVVSFTFGVAYSTRRA